MKNKMIVIDGIDGSGKGVQTRRLYQALKNSGHSALLTREPGGSPAAEDIRTLLVEGDPEKWDSMTELLLMYAARRSHLRDTVWPALENGSWIVSDRYADSSRAFQGIAGELGLEIVEKIHQLAIGFFEPELVLILDIPYETGLQRALNRKGNEDRFEKKPESYHAKVRQAFLQIAQSDKQRYTIIDGSGSINDVSTQIFDAVNKRFDLSLAFDPDSAI